MDILIKNGRVVDGNKDQILDIYIRDGKIFQLGRELDIPGVELLDCKGLVVMPGFIDLHAHFREPGFEYKEDLESGSLAALRGGYTTVNLMANTRPVISSMDLVERVLKRSRDLDLIDIHQTVSLSDGFDGKTLDHLKTIDFNRVKFVSEDGLGVMSNELMYRAMKLAVENDFTIMSHAEDMDLSPIDYRLAENIMTLRDLYLSEVTGASLHMCHVSTREAIEAIRAYKKRNHQISCEVTPHHIYMWDSDYRVNPPIRTRDDSLALIEAIVDGTVDAIGTDHAPHSREDKLKGAAGMSGIELAFSLAYTALVKPGHIDLKGLSKLMSSRPGEIFREKKGKIEVGYLGDLVAIDLDKSYTIDRDDFLSKGKNTPLEGERVFAKPVYTIKEGRLKYRSDNIL